ncbi:GNAT family N-acetyltransferase [Dechloromonas sp. CZR5]|uniref:GNAT family N-acetyltransferase n=1 Tax=Dechloromonas sp. CZR5 TaxID=2608630 RepID=UPI00123DA832|nr:GNAT family N-acetyltransferase [Dechloromonas sp. CZR5]
MLKNVFYYFSRLGFVFKIGGYSFFCLDKKIDLVHDSNTMNLREVENDVSDNEIFGWLTIKEARQLINNPLHRFFLLQDSGVVVASCWAQFCDIDLEFIDIKAAIPQKSVYLSHVIVKNEFRGKGYSSRLLELVSDKLQREGFCRIYICCDNRNVSIRKVFARLGFYYYLGVRFFRLGLFRFYTYFSESGCSHSCASVNPFPLDVRFLGRTDKHVAARD